MKSVKDRLKEVMDANRYNILAVSEATGIPSPRMYKWFKEGTNPKAEDCEKLEKWMSSLEKPLIQEPAAEGQKKDPLLGDLIVSTRKLSDSNLINAENIRRLITLLEFSLGKQNTAPVEHLPGPPIEQADYGPAKVENLIDKKKSPSKGK